MTYLIKVPPSADLARMIAGRKLHTLATLPDQERLPLIKICKEAIKQASENPDKNENFLIPYLPFQKNLDIQFSLWRTYISENPQLKSIAEAIAKIYGKANSTNGFSFKLNDSVSIYFNNGELSVSIDNKNPISLREDQLQTTRNNYWLDLITGILGRELKGIDHIQANSREYNSLVTQIALAPEEVQDKTWFQVADEIKTVHKSLNEKKLPEALAYIAQIYSAQIYSAIPSDRFLSPYTVQLGLTGVLTENGVRPPTDEQIPLLFPTSRLFIGLLGSEQNRQSSNYPDNWHTMSVGSQNEHYSFMPRGLTAVSFRGEEGSSSGSSGGNSPKEPLNFQVGILSPDKFLPTSIHADKAEIQQALKSLSSLPKIQGNQLFKTIIDAIAKLLKPLQPVTEQKVGKSQTKQSTTEKSPEEKLKDILDIISKDSKYSALLPLIQEAIYLGKGVKQVSLLEAKEIISDVSQKTHFANLLLKDLGYPLGREANTENNSSAQTLQLAAEVSGAALRSSATDTQAQLAMAKAKIKQSRDFGILNEANLLLNQVIESKKIQGKDLAEIYLLRAYTALMVENNPQNNPQKTSKNKPTKANSKQKTWHPVSTLINLVEKQKEISGKDLVQKYLDKAIEINSDLINEIKAEITSLKNIPEPRLNQLIHLENLMLLLIHHEPTNIKLYVDLTELYDSINSKGNEGHANTSKRAMLSLLENSEQTAQSDEQIKEIVNSCADYYLKLKRLSPLLEIFAGNKEKYVNLYKQSHTERDTVYLLLSMASIEKDSQAKESWIEYAKKIKPDIYEELTNEAEKTEKKLTNREYPNLVFQLWALETDSEKRKELYVDLILLTQMSQERNALLGKMTIEYGKENIVDILSSGLKKASLRQSSYLTYEEFTDFLEFLKNISKGSDTVAQKSIGMCEQMIKGNNSPERVRECCLNIIDILKNSNLPNKDSQINYYKSKISQAQKEKSENHIKSGQSRITEAQQILHRLKIKTYTQLRESNLSEEKKYPIENELRKAVANYESGIFDYNLAIEELSSHFREEHKKEINSLRKSMREHQLSLKAIEDPKNK